MKAVFIPRVNDELDTQNFEKFEEVYKELVEKTKSTPRAKVENNKFCLSMHYRCVEEKVVESKFVFEAKFIQVIEFQASLSKLIKEQLYKA
uniref:Uncharacterized protein n=1 Tax=Cucumis melo TaxID=3656 RepID=A0A9I9EKK6_CUCME